MGKATFEDRKPLSVNYMFLWCPYCDKTWARGGRAEGFRKAGAQRHVWSCFEKSVKARGLRLGNWSDPKQGYRLVRSVDSCTAENTAKKEGR